MGLSREELRRPAEFPDRLIAMMKVIEAARAVVNVFSSTNRFVQPLREALEELDKT